VGDGIAVGVGFGAADEVTAGVVFFAGDGVGAGALVGAANGVCGAQAAHIKPIANASASFNISPFFIRLSIVLPCILCASLSAKISLPRAAVQPTPQKLTPVNFNFNFW